MTLALALFALACLALAAVAVWHADTAEIRHAHRSIDHLTRLARIAAMETPHANATVRRMARVARGEPQ